TRLSSRTSAAETTARRSLLPIEKGPAQRTTSPERQAEDFIGAPDSLFLGNGKKAIDSVSPLAAHPPSDKRPSNRTAPVSFSPSPGSAPATAPPPSGCPGYGASPPPGAPARRNAAGPHTSCSAPGRLAP